MKYYILKMQALVVMLLSLITSTGCDFGVARGVVPSEQKGVAQGTKESEQGEEQTTALLESLSFKAAKEKYIGRFGKPKIEFTKGSNDELSVTITTKDLNLTSARITEAELYHEYIYSNKEVMEKYATGDTQNEKYAENRIKKWQKDRWEKGNPFAGFTVFLKSGEFLGNVVLGGADEAESGELAYFIRKDKWFKEESSNNPKYGSQMVGAIVLFYAPKLAKKGYKLPDTGQDFKRIVATCRIDNKYSEIILRHTAMKPYGTSEKFGHLRNLFELKVADMY
jgi:hypothetical protein